MIGFRKGGDERALLQAGFRFALSLTADRAEAEDFVQEAWCRLYRRHGRVTDKPLLFAAIRNLYFDHHRRQKLVVFESLEEAAEPAADDPSLEAKFIARDLAGPLATLRAEERESLYLTIVEGYTADEAAHLTERTRGTVLSLVHRAKVKLRRALLAGDDVQAPEDKRA